MNVGVISDVGFVAEQNLVREWQARGIKAVSSADVCRAMGQMLAWNLPSRGLSRKVDIMAYFQAISESSALKFKVPVDDMGVVGHIPKKANSHVICKVRKAEKRRSPISSVKDLWMTSAIVS